MYLVQDCEMFAKIWRVFKYQQEADKKFSIIILVHSPNTEHPQMSSE